jgi:uncharacterized protein
MFQKNIMFQNEEGRSYSGVLRVPKEDGKHPAVLICHGFLENKDNGLIADIANGLSYYGFVTLRFDFLFHGESHGGSEEMTLTQQVKDIRQAVDYLKTIEQVDTRRMILLGHDLGGVGCLLANHEEVDGIILLNVRVDTKKFIMSFMTDLDLREWIRSGWLVINDVSLRKEFYEDLVHYDVIKEIKDEKIPILIIHGTNDKRVPEHEARELFHQAANAELELIEGADHHLSNQEHKMYAIEFMADWINKILGT